MNQKPPVTFAVFAFNQERFIREAVEGALSQTYSPMEIILSDDASTDDTYRIMEEMAALYRGPHSIKLNRNHSNLGIGGHFCRVMEFSTGEIILPAGGDDISLPERTRQTVALLDQYPEATTVSLALRRFKDGAQPDYSDSDNPGSCDVYSIKDYIDDPRLHLNGAARGFRKQVYEWFGVFSESTPVEDSPMFFRCLLMGTALESNQVGVLHRQHENNMFASGNRFKLDYEKIYQNHFRDLEKAKSSGLISEELRGKARHAARRRLERHQLLIRIAETENHFRFFLANVLFSDLLGTREKLKLLMGKYKQIGGYGAA